MIKSKKFLMFLMLIVFFIFPIFSYAEGGVNKPSLIKFENPFNGGDDFMSLLVAILNKVIMPIAAVVVVVLIIWAGFTYLLAQGKPGELEKAHKRLLWTLIGAGVLLGAAAISKVVQEIVKSLTT